LKLPEDFILGVSTSAYQVEGAAEADGRGPSIWDTFNVPGTDNGRSACDHYNRWKEDVDLMEELGAQAYRFSVAWPRIIPDGKGAVNSKGLDFYSRLVDRLLEKNIEPWLTLYHWDLPVPLQDKGGWRNRETVEHFLHYTSQVVSALGDRVKNWITVNEPWSVTVLGYQTGEHAPGEHGSTQDALRVIHHLFLAHGRASRLIREEISESKVGIVLNPWIPIPLRSKVEDIRAADRAWDEQVSWWFEPVLLGRYPTSVEEMDGADMGFVQEGDLEKISPPLDFLGLNVYFPDFIRGGAGEQGEHAYEEYGALVNLPRTEMGWRVYPPAIAFLLSEVNRRYDVPDLYITETGCATPDLMSDRDEIHDLYRIEFLRTHLMEALEVGEAEDIPLKGLFAWSLLDNYEWDQGYEKRFGLYYVDYETMQRRPKDSASWYARLSATRELSSWKFSCPSQLAD